MKRPTVNPQLAKCPHCLVKPFGSPCFQQHGQCAKLPQTAVERGVNWPHCQSPRLPATGQGKEAQRPPHPAGGQASRRRMTGQGSGLCLCLGSGSLAYSGGCRAAFWACLPPSPDMPSWSTGDMLRQRPLLGQKSPSSHSHTALPPSWPQRKPAGPEFAPPALRRGRPCAGRLCAWSLAAPSHDRRSAL